MGTCQTKCDPSKSNEITSTYPTALGISLCPVNEKCCVRLDAKCRASGGTCQATPCDTANYNLIQGAGLCPTSGDKICCVRKEHGCAASDGTCEVSCNLATTDELAGTGLCPSYGKNKCCKIKNTNCTSKGGTCRPSCTKPKVDQGPGLCAGKMKCCINAPATG